MFRLGKRSWLISALAEDFLVGNFRTIAVVQEPEGILGDTYDSLLPVNQFVLPDTTPPSPGDPPDGEPPDIRLVGAVVNTDPDEVIAAFKDPTEQFPLRRWQKMQVPDNVRVIFGYYRVRPNGTWNQVNRIRCRFEDKHVTRITIDNDPEQVLTSSELRKYKRIVMLQEARN